MHEKILKVLKTTTITSFYQLESPNTQNNAKPILPRLELALDWNFDLLPTEKVTEIVENLLDKAQFNETRNQTISAPFYKLANIS